MQTALSRIEAGEVGEAEDTEQIVDLDGISQVQVTLRVLVLDANSGSGEEARMEALFKPSLAVHRQHTLH